MVNHSQQVYTIHKMDQQNKEERTARLTVILGANGTGKSTLIRDILKANDEKSLVITPHDVEWLDCEHVDLDKSADFLFSGIRRHIFDDDKKDGTLGKVKYFKKGKLVFDDCRYYFEDKTPKALRALLIARRQRMVDVFAVGHGFNEVPPVFFTYASHIILFRTTTI